MALQRKLERIRQSWKDGRPPRFHRRTEKPSTRVGASEFSKCGPGGQVREHPTVLGMRWLSMFAEALKIHGVVWAWRVSAESWENDGCVSLYLQRVVHQELPAFAVSVGPMGARSQDTEKVALGGGAWEKTRVPIGMINNHDIKAVLKKVVEPKRVPIIMAGSHILKAMEGF